DRLRGSDERPSHSSDTTAAPHPPQRLDRSALPGSARRWTLPELVKRGGQPFEAPGDGLRFAPDTHTEVFWHLDELPPHTGSFVLLPQQLREGFDAAAQQAREDRRSRLGAHRVEVRA